MPNKSCVQILNAKGDVVDTVWAGPHREFVSAHGIRETATVTELCLKVKPLPTAKERRAARMTDLFDVASRYTSEELIAEIEKIFSEEQD